MASFIPRPVDDALEGRPEPERLYSHDGALLTQDDFRSEQLYFRGQIARLAVYLHGAGTMAGLWVRYDPVTGDDIEVKVLPGLALDRLGRIIELPQDSCLKLAAWMRQQNDDPIAAAHLAEGLRPAGGGLPEHVVADVYLGYHACARTPAPAFATANADTIDGIQPSRILDTGRLELVVRPRNDDRVPKSMAAVEFGEDPISAEQMRDEKLQQRYGLGRPSGDPMRLPAGGSLSEHLTAGGRQDGSEILLARLTLPVVTGGDPAIQLDTSINFNQSRFIPNQTIRPLSYSADEIVKLTANLWR